MFFLLQTKSVWIWERIYRNDPRAGVFAVIGLSEPLVDGSQSLSVGFASIRLACEV